MKYNDTTELFLCIFLGWAGVHRFYVKKNISATIYLLTFGLFGIGWIIDLVSITANSFYVSQKSMGNKLPQNNMASHTTTFTNFRSSYKFNYVNFFTKKWSSACFSEFVVLDFETTGLNPHEDKIVEFAAIRYKDGVLQDYYTSLINPKIKIPPLAYKIHGISDYMVRDAPYIENCIDVLINFIGDSIIVAHNAPFDMGFLAANTSQIISNPVIDTLKISRKMFPQYKNHKLITVAKNLNVPNNTFHRSHSDAVVTAGILLKCIEIYQHEITVLN